MSTGSLTPFNPLQFYGLSKAIAQNQSEVCLRTAVGRAYYAMHLYAKSRPQVEAKMRVIPQGRMGSHEHVIVAIKSIAGFTTTGDQLASLKKLRVTADYHMTITDTRLCDWQKNWQRAQTLISTLEVELAKL